MEKEFIRKAVDLYSDTVLRVAHHYVRSRTDAEDIMQDVFMALLDRSQDAWGDEEHVKAWLIRVAINKSKDYLKSTKRRTVELKDVYSYTLDKEEYGVLDKVRLLPPVERNLIYLFYFESYSAEEIAVVLKMKPGTVYVKLARARNKLKDILEGDKIHGRL